MCDQDFEEDLKVWEAKGLVTRKQFGALLGAGVAMMLPQVANAVTVTRPKTRPMFCPWPGCSSGPLPIARHQTGKKVLGPNQRKPTMNAATVARMTASQLISGMCAVCQ